MKRILIIAGLLISGLSLTAQSIERIEPPSWWVGIPHLLQLLVYGEGIAEWQVKVDYPGVRIARTTRVSNPNYLFLDLHVADTTQAGKMELTFTKGSQSTTKAYTLHERSFDPNRIRGLTGNDVMYLIYPDRFANGDPSNDRIPGMLDQTLDRKAWSARHGGDLQGILDHIDYLDSLHVTALWLNPIFTNNEPRDSYHGYAATDLYAVDPRLGSAEEYRALGDSLQVRGKALVMDVVHNHVGSQHWMAVDPPKDNWFHQWPEYTHSNFKAPTLHDPYAAPQDQQRFTEGWFAPSMPDLNQDEPLLQQYLIQQAIWWVEFAGVDAYRLDTYAFSDNDFLANWTATLQSIYPDLLLFGETFVFNKATQVYNHGASKVKKDFASQLDGVTDFQWHFAAMQALQEPFGWTTGWSRIYNLLTQDYLLEQPVNNVLFLDNHDTDRLASTLEDDAAAMRQALTLLLTQRGIPCLYYGTEWGFTGTTDPDGKVRTDFPGGWAGDSLNYFLNSEWPTSDTSLFRWIQTLTQLREQHPWVGTGEMRQLIPQDGIYTYFRYAKPGTLLVLLNSNPGPTEVATHIWSWPEREPKLAFDVLQKKPLVDWQTITIPAHGVRIIRFTH